LGVEVKICGIKDVWTARESVRAGADYIGLVLAPSTRQISLDQAREITRALPEVRFVAVVRNMAEEELAHVLQHTGVWAVQYHGASGYDWIGMAHKAGLRAIATRVEGDADIILLDGPEPGQGQSWEWQRPQLGRPVWIAGGLSPDNVAAAVNRVVPDGVDVAIGVETSGSKDMEKIIRFIKEAKQWQ
jgi:phosphoribosylanthranilate isomerase